MPETLFNQLQELFRKVFENPLLQIQLTTTANDIKAWDSLIHMTLISEIETYFSIQFTFEEVSNFNTVGDMLHVIALKTKLI